MRQGSTLPATLCTFPACPSIPPRRGILNLPHPFTVPPAGRPGECNPLAPVLDLRGAGGPLRVLRPLQSVARMSTRRTETVFSRWLRPAPLFLLCCSSPSAPCPTHGTSDSPSLLEAALRPSGLCCCSLWTSWNEQEVRSLKGGTSGGWLVWGCGQSTGVRISLLLLLSCLDDEAGLLQEEEEEEEEAEKDEEEPRERNFSRSSTEGSPAKLTRTALLHRAELG